MPAPGAELLERFQATFGGLPFLAEDLGLVTPEVRALCDRFGLPGMRVLQFAFGDGDLYLPHRYPQNCAVYTGTHDNDTAVGWFESLNATPHGQRERRKVLDYVGASGRDVHWDLIRIASMSVADLALFPMQDLLGLDASTALVRDTAVYGATSPIKGSRTRLEFSPTFGDLRLNDVTLDYRHYVMPFRPITFAGRAIHDGRYGSSAEDERLAPLFLGYPGLVRGYDVNTFNASDCTFTATGACPEYDRLLGTRILVFNGEVRAPLAGLFNRNLDYGPIPVEVKVEPLVELQDASLVWYVGLDAEATRIGDALWNGEELDNAARGRVVGLYRLTFGDANDVEDRVRGEAVYLIGAMTADKVLRLKPQNLITGLPVRRLEVVN